MSCQDRNCLFVLGFAIDRADVADYDYEHELDYEHEHEHEHGRTDSILTGRGWTGGRGSNQYANVSPAEM